MVAAVREADAGGCSGRTCSPVRSVDRHSEQMWAPCAWQAAMSVVTVMTLNKSRALQIRIATVGGALGRPETANAPSDGILDEAFIPPPTINRNNSALYNQGE